MSICRKTFWNVATAFSMVIGLISISAQANPGLMFTYFDPFIGHYVREIPDDAQATLTGTVANFSIEAATSDSFAFRFKGKINIPATASYTFTLDSDDGSELLIDGNRVVIHDFLHGGGDARTGSVTLTAGYHPIQVNYFQHGGGSFLSIEWQSASIPISDIPDDVLSFDPPNAVINHASKNGAVEFLSVPNTFSHSLPVQFSVPGKSNVSVDVYSLNGMMLRNLFRGTSHAGINNALWDGRDENGKLMGGGTYVVVLNGELNRMEKRATMLK